MVPLNDDIVGRETSGLEMSPTGAAGEAVHDVLLRAPEVQPGWWLDLQARLCVARGKGGGLDSDTGVVWGLRGGHEAEVTRKYRLFREMFSSLFYLVLIVPPNEYVRVRDSYPESYDDMVEDNRMGDLLYILKTGRYKQIF